jgi:hypothetical protein
MEEKQSRISFRIRACSGHPWIRMSVSSTYWITGQERSEMIGCSSLPSKEKCLITCCRMSTKMMKRRGDK